MDMYAKWKFATPGNGTWQWYAAHADGAQVASPSAFESVEDCMADAARHGYADYRPTEAPYT